MSTSRHSASRGARIRKRAAAKSASATNRYDLKELRRFRAAMDMSEDSICLIDRATMRFIDMNATACRYYGYTRREFLRIGPQDLLVHSRADIERAYDQLIAAPDVAVSSEIIGRRKDGSHTLIEVSRRALRFDDRWIILSVAHDIAAREADRDRTTQALRASEEKYRRILENMEDAYYEVDLKGNLVFFNPAFIGMLGYPQSEVHGMNNRVFQPPDVAARVYKTFNDVYRTGVPAKAYDWEMRRMDGATVLVEGSVQLVKDAQNRPIGFRGMLRDVTSRRAMEHALRESEARFRSLIELSTDWYWELDAEFRFARVEIKDTNHDSMTHADSDIGKRPWETEIEAEGGWEKHRELLTTHRSFHDLVTYRARPDGTPRYATITGEPIFDAGGTFQGYRGIGRDITTQKLSEQRIQYLATHDSLTDLPNRMLFNELLGIAVQAAQRQSHRLAVLFIDLDGFKAINDALGHEMGDRLLREIAGRLKQILRGSDVVARHGGDEFVVLLQDVSDADTVSAVARKILAVVNQPAALTEPAHRITTSIGISLFPTDAEGGSTLLQHADAAMYAAKEAGKNDFRFYSHKIKR